MAPLLERICEDVDDQAQSLGGWHQHYDQLGRGRFRGQVWQRVAKSGTVLREATNCHLRELIAPPSDTLVLAVPLTVVPGSTFAGRPLTRDCFLVLGQREEHELQVCGDFDVVALAVHRDLLHRLPLHKLEWVARAENERSQLLPPDVADLIRHSLMVWLDHSHDPPSDTDPHWLGAILTQTLILTMQSEHQQASNTLPRRAGSRQRVVKRAVDYLHSHLFEEVRVEDICAAAFASRRTLQYCFEELLQTTPQAYLRALRLNEARRQLRRPQSSSITEIASAMGFSSASHFTQLYKQMFGVRPSDTSRRATTFASEAVAQR